MWTETVMIYIKILTQKLYAEAKPRKSLVMISVILTEN
jgi:hypothetical protein